MQPIRKPTRAQLQSFIQDQQVVLALGELFDAVAAVDLDLMKTGDLIWTATHGTTRAGALLANGQAVSRTTYADLFAVLTRSGTGNTFDITTDRVTFAAHGLLDTDRIQFYSTGTIPTGLVEGTVYFVRDKTDDTFKVAATSGGAAINLTVSNGTGTQKWISAPYGDGDGEPGTTFNVPNAADIGGISNTAFIVY